MRAKRETEKGIPIFYSTTVINNNKSLKVIEMEPIKTLNNRINNLVKMEEPEIIKVDLFIEGDKWLEGNVCDLRSKEGNTPTTNFQGLGEVEINAIVEKRFDEKKREYEYLEMTEAVKELSNENVEV